MSKEEKKSEVQKLEEPKAPIDEGVKVLQNIQHLSNEMKARVLVAAIKFYGLDYLLRSECNY